VLDVGDKNEKIKYQNLVRSLGGIRSVLGACGPNHQNQIRNWALQAINQLCCDPTNEENQAAINELEKIGNVEHQDVSVDRDQNGKYHFKRISHNK